MYTFFVSIAFYISLFLCTPILWHQSPLLAATHIVLIGLPGSGKGTFSNFMTKHSSNAHTAFEHISPGDLLRKEVSTQTGLGIQIQERVNRGELIPNEIVWGLVSQKLVRIIEGSKAAILDGFPVSEDNFNSLCAFMHTHPEEQFIFLHLNAPPLVCVQRICARYVCTACGEVYNGITSMPKCQNTCDVCNGALSRRRDDTLEHATKRIANTEKKIQSVLERIRARGCNIIEMNTDCSVEECYKQYANLLGE